MKYWKQGFYDEPVKGSVEIKDEYYYQLLDGQSSGKEIKENEKGFPVLVEHEYHIEELRDIKVAEIRSYDKSEAVNSFVVGDSSGWFDKSTRVGLQNSIQIEKEAGKKDTTLWIANKPFVLPIEKALGLLREIELHAILCNNTTQSHIASVIELTDKDMIAMYDFKTGYPDILSFDY